MNFGTPQEIIEEEMEYNEFRCKSKLNIIIFMFLVVVFGLILFNI
jgi:hypothetical protein